MSHGQVLKEYSYRDPEERIRILSIQFRRVRDLLRQNKIRNLDYPPPSFVPILPHHAPPIKSSSVPNLMSGFEGPHSKLPDCPIFVGPHLYPQLGTSYSLEDDMPPGVKEVPSIERTFSTFRSPASSPVSGSSKSELKLNDFSEIPLGSPKSTTLPHGLESFYSSTPDACRKHREKEKKESFFLFRGFSKKEKKKSDLWSVQAKR